MTIFGIVREDQATDGTRLYLAEAPDLPGCQSHGATPAEALLNLQEAVALYREVRASG